MTAPLANEDDSSLEQEELELQRKLDEIRARKAKIELVKQIDASYDEALELDALRDQQLREKYEKDWDEALLIKEKLEKAIDIDNIQIIGDRIHFKVPYRDDMVALLRTVKSRQYNAIEQSNSMEVPDWKPFIDKVNALPNVKINYDTDQEKEIQDWKTPANYKISMDGRGFLIKLGPKASNHKFYSIPGGLWFNPKREWRFALTEAWRIAGAMEGEEAEWQDEAHAYALKQIETRASLDTIAKKEKPDIEYVLNGSTLKDFQGVTVEFSEAAGDRMLIAHEMGLGKTPCAIAIMKKLMDSNEGKKFLIIVPASLRPNWKREIRKFMNMPVYDLYGASPNNYDIAQVLAGKHTFYLINYDILAEVTKVPQKEEIINGERHVTPATERFLWVDILNHGNFDMIVMDEAHYAKNVGSLRSRACRDLISPRILLLTGTPLLNRPSELWPIIKLIDSDVAGAYETFVKQYTIDGKQARNIEELREVMKPIMFRKTKKDVLKELPPINRITREYELTASARRAYEKVVEGLWVELDDWSGDMSKTQVITSILAQLLKMKQVCAWDKVEYVTDLAWELYDQSDNGHRKVIIFSKFVNLPEVVPTIAKKLGHEALWFSGQHNPQERQNIVDTFQNDPDKHFLVASLDAAKLGLNITAAGSVIFNDLDWTPANHHQAEARAYGRLSDLHSINSYYVVAENTIEEDIMELLAVKLALFESIIEGAEASRDVSVAMEIIKKLKAMRK